MAQKRRTKEQYTEQNLDSMMEFEDRELEETMRDFLEEEKKANSNIWNFATIAGIAMFFVGMIYLVQSIGLWFGPDLSGIVSLMPLIGGILVTMVGFGFLVGDRKRVKKSRKKKKKRREFNFDFGESAAGRQDEEFSLDNDLEGGFSGRGRSSSSKYNFDSFALRQPKKLYKSRTDKKWAGVCGGLSKYFGISSTAIRLLFFLTLFPTSGGSLIVYIALAVALDKEPPELMDDFNY